MVSDQSSIEVEPGQRKVAGAEAVKTVIPHSFVSAWCTWACVSLFYAYQYILRVLPSIVLNDISERFDLSPALLGQYSGFYYLGYALTHIPIGIAMDRFGPKKVLPLFMVLSVVGTLPLVWSATWWVPIIGRALVGIGSSAAILGIFRVTRTYFSEKRFARMLSFSVIIGLAGAIYGGGPLQALRWRGGYEFVIYLVCLVGLGLALVTYCVLPRFALTDGQGALAEERERGLGYGRRLRDLLLRWEVGGICLAAALMVGPLEGFADVWGARYLVTTYGMSESTAVSLPSLIFLGMGLGGSLLSLLSERIGHSLLIIIACSWTMGVGFLLLMSATLNIWTVAIVLGFLGIGCGYQILAIDFVARQVATSEVGMATALTNMSIMMGGYFFHGVIGKTIDWQIQQRTTGAMLTPDSLNRGLSVIPIALILAGFLIWGVHRRRIIASGV